jgi:D-alanyl-lipoteichoic acid acyltransferase DltB (MBOAT superfamily)
LRDYIYIPLGGNKKGSFRTYSNLLAAFVIGGFWHGAGWTFLFWGFLHGIALVIHRLWSNLGFKIWTWLAWFITFNFVNIAWVFFRAKEWEDAVKVIKGMFLGNVLISTEFANAVNYFNPMINYFKIMGVKYTGFVNIYIFEMIIVAFIMVLGFKNSMEIFFKDDFKLSNKDLYKYSILMALLFLIALFKGSIQEYSEFIYFNF